MKEDVSAVPHIGLAEWLILYGKSLEILLGSARPQPERISISKRAPVRAQRPRARAASQTDDRKNAGITSSPGPSTQIGFGIVNDCRKHRHFVWREDKEISAKGALKT